MKTEKTDNPNRQEIKDLIKSGKAFSFIGDRIAKAYKAPDGDFYIEAIASSDQEDLVGDVMTTKALKKMETDFVGKTVFMNHRTNIPDDVFGSIKSARIVKQDGVQLLVFEIVVEKENEAAMKTWRVIEGGRTQLGTSVTVLVNDAKPNPARKGGIIIDDVEPIELSIVGVPCNREAKTLAASASKALAVALSTKSIEVEMIEETNDNAHDAIPVAAAAAAEASAEETPNADAAPAAATAGTGKSVMVVGPRSAKAIETFQALQASIKDAPAGETVQIAPVEVTVKGMFNEILEQEPTLWELFDILNEVRWELYYEKSRLEYLGQTDFSELLAKWSEALDEFKAAAEVSFRYWGDFDTDASVVSASFETAVELEKSLTTLAEAIEKSSDENKDSLREIGARMLEIAKAAGIELPAGEDAPAAAAVGIHLTETEEFAVVLQRAEKAEGEAAELRKQLEDTQAKYDELREEHEITKAGLAAAVEATSAVLRQPLSAA